MSRSDRRRCTVTYPPTVEQSLRAFHHSLGEKDRRHYAATEALRLGHTVSFVRKLFGTSPKTVSRGRRELTDPEALSRTRIRLPGAGRKRVLELRPRIHGAFLEVLRHHTAGSPMDEQIKWTNLTRDEMAEGLARRNCPVSVTVVDQLLAHHDYRRRKAQKRVAGGHTENRNEQFLNIQRLIGEYHRAGNPVMSMDTKKKEHLGNLYRDGKLYTRETLATHDHDFPSLAEGKVIPHALFDLFANLGYISLGTSHDTGEFACDSIRHWWYDYGRELYPEATGILLLCDSGGSHDARFYIFKEDLQTLANEIGIPLRVAHYPPYTSKYNPIDHRFFPHVTRACQGVIFKSVELVKELMERTKTRKGLRAMVTLIDKVYQTKRKASREFLEEMPICFDEYLPKWNYQAIPNRSNTP